MNRSTPGLPVHHQLLEFTQTHVHWVRDAIQPSHPWSSPSPPAPNLSQHQSLFQWVNSSHEVAKVLEFQLQHQSFQRNPRAAAKSIPDGASYDHLTFHYWCLVAKLCPTLCDPIDCSPPGSSVHGIHQARILERVAVSFSRGSSSPRDWTLGLLLGR